jgi:hypothetical protein
MIAEYLGYLLDAWDTFIDFIMIPFYARTIPDWRFILIVFLIGAFFLGSAFIAATIAESRRHKMKIHFLLGLIAPYIYPIVMAFRMKTAEEVVEIDAEFDPLADLSSDMSARLRGIQNAQKQKHDKRVKRITPKKDTEVVEQEEIVEETSVEEAPVVPETAVESEEIVEETASVFNQRYFQELAVDSSGAKAGPFNLLVKTGTLFKVLQIKNIQADMASFEIEVGGKVKNIRIKYDNIENFEKI